MLMDVETAFFYGKIEEEIYMEVPVGMKEVFSVELKQMKKTHATNYQREYMDYANQQDNSGNILHQEHHVEI